MKRRRSKNVRLLLKDLKLILYFLKNRLSEPFKFAAKLSFKLSPASEASRKVANLTERKNTHPPVYGVKEFVCLSVCLFVSPFLLQKQPFL